MTHPKVLLSRRFARALAVYDREAVIQAEMAEALLQALSPYRFERKYVLEIGAGTGLFTRRLLARKRPAFLITLDLTPACAKYLRPLPFVVADGENPPFKPESFDFILANAVFQWFLNPQKAFVTLAGLLKPGGLLAFTTFGPATMKEFGRKERPPGLNALNEIRAMKPAFMKEIKALSWQRVLYFPSPREILKHVRHTGAMGFLKPHWSPKEIKRWEMAYESLRTPAGFPLTFEPVLIVWQR